MRYPPSVLDDIRNRLPVSRVVERRVTLKRAGREYIGLSPFKTERTPSFTVNDRKGFYHCFASGEHGDVFKFVMQTEGLSFVEAVERLAAESGVALPKPDAGNEGTAQHEQRLREAMDEACKFFQAALRGPPGIAARAYLAGRHVTGHDIEAFRLGYAPEGRTSLKNHLTAKGFSLTEMQDAGLVIHGPEIPVSYDRFRGRLMFPIGDAKGRPIAFGARALAPGRQPKYLNSPETPLFSKGRTLFNFAAARAAARVSQAVIVAEGYLDVVALTRAGFGHAVAPLGTALTEEQMRLLWTMAPVPVVCFDGDAAGRKAAFRAIDVALPHLEPSRTLQFVSLPEAQDPDDVLRVSGADALAGLISKAVPLFEVLCERERQLHPLDTPEQRAAFQGRLTGLIGKIGHKELRFQYNAAVREKFRFRPANRPRWGAEAAIAEAGWRTRSALNAQSARRVGGSAVRVAESRHTASLLKSAVAQPMHETGVMREALIVKALVYHPWLLDDFAECVAGIVFADPDCAYVRDVMLTWHHDGALSDSRAVDVRLSDPAHSMRFDRVRRILANHARGNFEPDAGRDGILESWRHILLLHYKCGGLVRELHDAQQDHFEDQKEENFLRVCAISQQVEIAIR